MLEIKKFHTYKYALTVVTIIKNIYQNINTSIKQNLLFIKLLVIFQVDRHKYDKKIN